MFYLFYIWFIVLNFLNQDSLLGLMQSVSLAIITIFIAVAIFLVDKDAGNFEFDRKVILNKVIDVKSLSLYLLFLLIPLFFWEILPNFLKLIPLTIFIYCFCQIAKSLVRTYKWMDVFEIKDDNSKKDNYRMSLRLDYFKTIKDPEERSYEWNYIWSNKGKLIATQDSNQYFKVLVLNIKDLLKEKNYRQAAIYLSNLINSVNNLPLYDWIFYENLLKETLYWHKLSFDLSKKKNSKDNIGDLIYFETTTENLLKELTNSLEKNRTEYLFFEFLKKHINENIKNEKYITKIVDLISSILFNLKTENLYSIFADSFPEEWKIKKETFKDNLVQKILLSNYLNWVQRKIWDHNDKENKGFDNNLETITNQLFPAVDPSTWACWLTFLISPYSKRVEEYLKKHRVFGLLGRVFTYTGERTDEMFVKDIANQKKETYELLLEIFPAWLSIEKLNEYKNEAEALHYGEHTSELLKKESFIRQINTLIRLQEKKKRRKK